MQNKKSNNKSKTQKVKSRKPETIQDDDDNEDFGAMKQPLDEKELEERLADEMLGETDVEDDEDFIQEVEKFKKEHSNSKIISVYNKIGKPKIADYSKLSPELLKTELRNLIAVLDDNNIIVHFHNDYTDREKYRFITNEIFDEVVDSTSKHCVKFIYEDYHPEADDDDEEDF